MCGRHFRRLQFQGRDIRLRIYKQKWAQYHDSVFPKSAYVIEEIEGMGRGLYGTFPQEVETTLSGKFPTNNASLPRKSNPISSTVSLTAVALSSSSPGSLFPPGSATWLVHRSPSLAARFMNTTSGSPCWTHGCAKNCSSWTEVGWLGSREATSDQEGKWL